MSNRELVKINPRKMPLPINLARQFQRERRIRNHGVGRNRKRNQRKYQRRKQAKDFECAELDALIHASEIELKEILENEDLLSDIPYSITPDELEGEISLAQGDGTTIYIQRDGLSTLTVVLPQDQPTIAQLKRAVAAHARVQLKRELRERHEERLRRRQTVSVGGDDKQRANSGENSQEQQQQGVKKRRTTCEPNVECSKSVHLTGELVCSSTHNGHQHRPNVSWRFLWRSYALFNLATKTLVNDVNGRKLLSECGIENAQTLKFTKREKYLGKKRQ